MRKFVLTVCVLLVVSVGIVWAVENCQNTDCADAWNVAASEQAVAAIVGTSAIEDGVYCVDRYEEISACFARDGGSGGYGGHMDAAGGYMDDAQTYIAAGTADYTSGNGQITTGDMYCELFEDHCQAIACYNLAYIWNSGYFADAKNHYYDAAAENTQALAALQSAYDCLTGPKSSPPCDCVFSDPPD